MCTVKCTGTQCIVFHLFIIKHKSYHMQMIPSDLCTISAFLFSIESKLYSFIVVFSNVVNFCFMK